MSCIFNSIYDTKQPTKSLNEVIGSFSLSKISGTATVKVRQNGQNILSLVKLEMSIPLLKEVDLPKAYHSMKSSQTMDFLVVMDKSLW